MKKISLRQEVFKYMDDNPKKLPSEVKEKFPNANRITIDTYIKSWRKVRYKRDIYRDKNQDPNINPPMRSIDDPEEFLMFVCLEELNRPDRDSRYASILLQLLDKKKAIRTKEVKSLSHIQNKSFKLLVKRLRENSQEESSMDISQRSGSSQKA